MPSLTTQQNTLQGQALVDLLDRAQALLAAKEEELQHISEAERHAAVAELLQQHTLAPANLQELHQLYHVWMVLEQPQAACAALHQHRATVLRNHADDPCAAVTLELWELDSRWHFDRAEGLHQLALLQAQLHSNPTTLQRMMDQWGELARRYQAWDLQEAEIDWRHQQPLEDYETQGQRQLNLHRFKMQLASERGNETLAQQHARSAIACMNEFAHTEGMTGAMQWERLHHVVYLHAPQCMEALVQAAHAHLHTIEPPVPTPVRRDWEVQYARWLARALAKQGQWKTALHWAERGHFRLDSDPFKSDQFGAERLRWLRKAKCIDEAAELAWQGIWRVRRHLAPAAYQWALQRREQDDSRPHWDWILAFARSRARLLQADEHHTGWLRLNPAPPLPAFEYLARAQRIAPNHPMHDLIAGVLLAERAQWKAALPLLERGVLALPDWADNHSVILLWCARFQCLTEQQALSRPFPESHNAIWCYDNGVDLIEDGGRVNTLCPSNDPQTRQRRSDLGLRYYEAGLARFEAFFATGQGAFMDADYGVYSNLCNNLAVQYRCHYGRAQEAPALHHKGMACQPLRQHQSNLLYCAWEANDWAEVLRAAEAHWHLIDEYDSRRSVVYYTPADHAAKIAESLEQENRLLEIGIWIERLNIWWQQQERQYGSEPLCRGDYLHALLHLLAKYALVCPHEAEILLRLHLPEVRALKQSQAGKYPLSETLRAAAEALSHCVGHAEETQTLYRAALAAVPASDAQTRADISRALKPPHSPVVTLRQCWHALQQRWKPPR